jgi:hypothetical protein
MFIELMFIFKKWLFNAQPQSQFLSDRTKKSKAIATAIGILTKYDLRL